MQTSKSYARILVLCRVLRMRWNIAPLLPSGVRFNKDDAMLAFARVPIFQTMTPSRFSHFLVAALGVPHSIILPVNSDQKLGTK